MARRRPRQAPFRTSASWSLGGLAVLFFCVGCASTDIGRPVSRGIDSALGAYLRLPLEGYDGEVAPEWAAEVRRAYRALVDDSSVEVARAAAVALDSRLDGFVPTQVLLAQTDFVQRNSVAVVDRLEPLLQDRAGYVPGQLLLGRAAELAGDPVVAYRAYRAALPDQLAQRRAEAVAEAAVQGLGGELEEALARGRLADARGALVELSDWAPASSVAVLGRWQLARAEGDVQKELLATRDLQALDPSRLDWQERRAELEVEIGDPKAGVDLYQDLSRRFPDDPRLSDRLAAAKFRWRLQVLPEDVVSLTGPRPLTRGDFATLLYWLIPGARTARGQGARIASDVPLEDPQREAIVRVVNLGLMDFADATLHQFSPQRGINRIDGLRSLIGWLNSQAGGSIASCTATASAAVRPSETLICQVAARCQLISAVADCLPGAPLSGIDAREAIRRTLDLVGGGGP